MVQRQACFIATAALLVAGWLSAPGYAADGTFQGTVVEPPASEQARSGWIFIKGPNRSLRRVEVTHAVVTLGPGVAHSGKRKCDWECLAVGQEIRVTAGQDSAGEWRAKRVEILHMAASNTYYSYRSAIMGSTLVALRAGT
jgi:hypothetical protein